jgi:hypothetical protein
MLRINGGKALDQRLLGNSGMTSQNNRKVREAEMGDSFIVDHLVKKFLFLFGTCSHKASV